MATNQSQKFYCDDDQNNNNYNKSNNKKRLNQPNIQNKMSYSRNSDCCSINFIKYILIIVDIVYFVSNTTHMKSFINSWIKVFKKTFSLPY